MKKKKNKKGFTLIELLIVIAIIGILASIILVSLSSARQRAKMAEFKATVSSMNAALVVECDMNSPDPDANVLWPTNNNSGDKTTGDFPTCSNGQIGGGSATSDPAQTGTTCVGAFGQSGVTFDTGC